MSEDLEMKVVDVVKEDRLDIQKPKDKVEMYVYNPAGLIKKIPLTIPNEDDYINYLKSIAGVYPFLAIVGLRILTEKLMKDLLIKHMKEYSEDDMLYQLIEKLFNNNVISENQKFDLHNFRKFENNASHGYFIQPDFAIWALDAIPFILRQL
ncbi:MAG: DUF4145 domain-containing protein [Nitrospirae bacterium]|nr:DUF4145 domain-containing protein [Nitrospirota bacterium]